MKGKVAIVTGASRGLGRAMAIGLAEAGSKVVLVARSVDALKETQRMIEEIGGVDKVVPADLTEKTAVEKIVSETLETFGKVDILVNNAGIIRRAPIQRYSVQDWDDVIATNLRALFLLSQAVAKEMVKKRYGKIINVASLLSFQGGIMVPAYTVSKHGVAGLTKAMANELAPYNVNVNAIAPGYFETENTRPLINDKVRFRRISERIPFGRWGQPEDLKGTVVFLASDASSYVHGHVLIVDGGWMAR